MAGASTWAVLRIPPVAGGPAAAAQALAAGVAAADEEHPAHDERRDQREADRQQQEARQAAYPEPEPDCSRRPSTATPIGPQPRGQVECAGQALRRRARAAVAPGAVVWAKSCPALGRGMEAITLPSPSIAATQ